MFVIVQIVNGKRSWGPVDPFDPFLDPGPWICVLGAGGLVLGVWTMDWGLSWGFWGLALERMRCVL